MLRLLHGDKKTTINLTRKNINNSQDEIDIYVKGRYLCSMDAVNR